MRFAPTLALGLVALAAASCKKEEPPPPPAPAAPAEPDISYAIMPPTKGYPLTTCVVTGKDLKEAGKDRFVIAYKGYEMQFCSKKCLWEFANAPEMYVKKAYPKAILVEKPK